MSCQVKKNIIRTKMEITNMSAQKQRIQQATTIQFNSRSQHFDSHQQPGPNFAKRKKVLNIGISQRVSQFNYLLLNYQYYAVI